MYRRTMLTSDMEKATKDLIAACCERPDVTLLAPATDQDHVHVCVSAPPHFAPAEIASLLKGYSSRSLRERFPHLKRVCGKDHLWAQSYSVGTARTVSAETIRHYIMECQGK